MCSICSFISSVEMDTIEYLSWITAIVGTIITVSTIIFTSFNEKNLEKLNELTGNSELYNINESNELKAQYLRKIRINTDEVIRLQSKADVYKHTLQFFKWTLNIFALLWLISGISLAINTTNLLPKIVTYVSTLGLVIVFLYIPDMINRFNKQNNYIRDNVNWSTFDKCIENFAKYESIKSELIVKELIYNYIQVSQVGNNIEVVYNQHIKINEYTVILRLKNIKGYIYIVCNIDKPLYSRKYILEEQGKQFGGLFQSIANSFNTDIKMFFINNKSKDCTTFAVEMITEQTSCKFKLIDPINQDQPYELEEIISDNSSYIYKKYVQSKKYNFIDK